MKQRAAARGPKCGKQSSRWLLRRPTSVSRIEERLARLESLSGCGERAKRGRI